MWCRENKNGSGGMCLQSSQRSSATASSYVTLRFWLIIQVYRYDSYLGKYSKYKWYSFEISMHITLSESKFENCLNYSLSSVVNKLVGLGCSSSCTSHDCEFWVVTKWRWNEEEEVQQLCKRLTHFDEP